MVHDTDNEIAHVSDTALWVAYYRAKESERPDALFRDPLAKRLIGERGKKIADSMLKMGRYTEWAVISRTVMIDAFIQAQVQDGVDTVVNLGTGLDTRPYRLNVPRHLKWIEVDYPQIIDLKNDLLKSEVPNCELTRVALDLANDQARKSFLSDMNARAQRILVLTEGVIPYLSEEQVASLARDLHAQPKITHWITEFFNPTIYRFLRSAFRTNRMKNAPFRFFPQDWLGFFAQRGWVALEIRYSWEIAKEHGRRMPMPWFANILKLFMSRAARERSSKMAGYMVLKRREG